MVLYEIHRPPVRKLMSARGRAAVPIGIAAWAAPASGLQAIIYSSGGGWPRMAFVAVAILGTAFFLLARRRFDWYSVAYASAIVYFLPGFFGYALLPRSLSRPNLVPVALVPDAYLVMAAVLTALICGAALFDLARLEHRRPRFRLQGSSWAIFAALGLALFGLAMTLATAGGALFGAPKQQVVMALGRWHHLFINCAMFGAVFAWVDRRRALGAAFGVMLLFDLYLGFRFPLAIVTIAICCLWMAGRGRRRIVLQDWAVGAAGLAAATFFFVVKRLVAPLRAGNWELLLTKLGDPREYVAAVTTSEPFKTQAILNEVIGRNLHIGLEHFGSLWGTLVVMAPESGVERTTFGTRVVSQQLFPEALAGVASNVWAEMWAAGGWPLIVLVLIVWVIMLGVLSYFLRAADPTFKSATAVLGAYWAFYLHRNDLLFHVILSRRVLAVAVVSLAVAMLAWAFIGKPAAPEQQPALSDGS